MNDEFVLKSPEKERKQDVSYPWEKLFDLLLIDWVLQKRESEIKEEPVNGRTAISIPGDLPSPKSKPPPTVVEKRNSHRQEQKEPREHSREHHNGAKVSNHHNNNNKVNSASLNNLILPLLSDVSSVENNKAMTIPSNKSVAADNTPWR